MLETVIVKIQHVVKLAFDRLVTCNRSDDKFIYVFFIRDNIKSLI